MKKFVFLSALLLIFGSLVLVNTSKAAGFSFNFLNKERPIKSSILNLERSPKVNSSSSTPALEKREQNKIRVEEKRAQKIRSYFGHMVRKLEAAINRENKLADRIESRLNKFAEQGKDISSPKDKLVDARLAIKDAQNLLDQVKPKLDEILTSEKPQEAFQGARGLVKSVVEKIRLAHRDLVGVIKSIRGMGWVKPAPSENAAPSIVPSSTPLQS